MRDVVASSSLYFISFILSVASSNSEKLLEIAGGIQELRQAKLSHGNLPNRDHPPESGNIQVNC
jgi:hypothetical protein